MYKELEKYKTGNKLSGKANLIKMDGTHQTIDHEYDEYIFEFGELMDDFIKHQRKPFWRKKYYDAHLSKLYKRVLNEITIKTGL